MLSFSESSSSDKYIHLECRQQINLHKAHHLRAIKRINDLTLKHKAELADQKLKFEAEKTVLLDRITLLEGQNKELKRRLYGKKSEKKKSKDDPNEKPPSKKKRGQKSGDKGHGRTKRPECLEERAESLELPLDDRTCSTCHLEYPEFGKPEVSEILEIEVKAYKRVISRPKYKTCTCEGHSKIITAPPANRLFPKTIYGVSIWHKFIINKYLFSVPNERTAKELKSLVGKISPGTICGGYQKISPLFDPLMSAFHEKLMTENYFNCDETFWKVFEEIIGKANYKWYIWGIFSESVRFYHFSPNRSTKNLHEIFSGLDLTLEEIILICDRYSAYKCYSKKESRLLVILAFCWAHVRRDFLTAANSYPELSSWMHSWVEKIRDVYIINGKRLEHWDPSKSLSEQNEEFQKHHSELRLKLFSMLKERELELAKKDLKDAQRKVLTSLQTHWTGLTNFFERPFIRLDNNLAEREVRLCVLGRKNFYGSGSVWSAKFSGKIYSFIKTYELWGLDASKGLYEYLQACSENGGKAPKNLKDFLPWEMSEERKAFFKSPKANTA